MAALNPDPKNHPPTAQTGQTGMSGQGQRPKSRSTGYGDLDDWLTRAQDAYYSSTTYVDANYRKAWEDGIRAFNNQHPADSKYNSSAFDKRSKVYRPKIRSVIRKNEAAAAAAFFSNMDVVSVTASDQSSKAETVSAEVMKHLLQYRLTKNIPWFQVVLGGIQDAQTTGVVCGHVYWDYKEQDADPEEMVEDALPEIVDTLASAVNNDHAHPAESLPGVDDGAGEGDQEYPTQPTIPQNATMATQDGQLQDGVEEPVAAVAVAAEPKIIKDEPCVDLIPAENLRIDAGANWMDPVNSSPFIIHLIPMYCTEVRENMDMGKWFVCSESEIAGAVEATPDSTRTARDKGRGDRYATDNKVTQDYSVVWVQRHIHRKGGQDWEFYTLGDQALLTEPRPLKETVFHGKRPYVIGCCILETHKIYPSSVPTLGRGLADETNELANTRMDNIKFGLNKKWFVKRGKEADVPGLVRNVPGGVVMLDDPEKDVREINWSDVTPGSFQEARDLGMEMDDLLGNFNPAQLMAQGAANNPARNMALLGSSSAVLTEYTLRTYVETFVQPVLRQIVLLEQEYETDDRILQIAGKRSPLVQKFGVDHVTDELLQGEMTLTVNVGMGATDPMMKLNKFLTGMSHYTAMLQKPVPGIDMKEVGKEIFGALGYSDGQRFFSSEDPQLVQMQQQVQQAQQMIAELNKKLQDQQTVHQVKLKAAQMTSTTKLQTTEASNKNKIQVTAIKEEGLNKRALATHWAALHTKGLDHEAAAALPRLPAKAPARAAA